MLILLSSLISFLKPIRNSIQENNKTEEDVDQYNEAVNIYNKAVKELNKANNLSQKKHKQLLKLWDKQVTTFFETHS